MLNNEGTIKESFNRCDQSKEFYKTFYDIFLGQSREIAGLFASTDFNKQYIGVRDIYPA